MQIMEIKDWGVLAGMKIPYKNGIAYFRIEYGEFAYIGESQMLPTEATVSMHQK